MVEFSGVPAKLDLLGTFFPSGLLPPPAQSTARKGTGGDVYTVTRLTGLLSEVLLHGCDQDLKILGKGTNRCRTGSKHKK